MSTENKRPYRMRKRAASQDATRQRITESAVELHERLGPAQTTMAAVAEHAGVQRSTLYRHFPDETSLFEACSAHWNAAHVPPDLGGWYAVPDPDERLRTALAELYDWYAGTGLMLDRMLRDEDLVPAVKERFGAFHGFLAAAREALLDGRALRPRPRARTAAAIDLALRFETWRTLCRDGGLERPDAVALMAHLVAEATG